MIWVIGLALLGAAAYWLFILTEGAYLGQRVVVVLYDRCASRYDAIKRVPPHDDAHHLARPLLEALRGVESPLVLDVAVGTGRLPLALLRQWDFAGRTVGLDLSQQMLNIGRCKTNARYGGLALTRADAMALPFPAGAFDAVTCVEALELLPNPRYALLELVRVLRPGGQLLVTNRVGVDAYFFPGRAFRRNGLEKRLRTMGLTSVRTRRWQVHYDLIQAQKLPPARKPGHRNPHLCGASASTS